MVYLLTGTEGLIWVEDEDGGVQSRQHPSQWPWVIWRVSL